MAFDHGRMKTGGKKAGEKVFSLDAPILNFALQNDRDLAKTCLAQNNNNDDKKDTNTTDFWHAVLLFITKRLEFRLGQGY